MLVTAIEDKLEEYLRAATIDDVVTHAVVSIERMLLDWDEVSDYPKILVMCEEVLPDFEAIQMVGNDYSANIFLLNRGNDYSPLVVERDIIIERIGAKLRANQRLGNLADNNSNEKVWDSKLGRMRFSKVVTPGGYQFVTWMQMSIKTERVGPFV